MIRLGNVLMVSGDRSQSETFGRRLADNSYACTIASTPEEGRALACQERPDLLLVGRLADCDPMDLAAGLKTDAATADIPVLLLAEAVTPQLCERALSAGVDDVIAASAEDAELLARLRPLIRLAVMHGELRQRAQTAKGFGLDARDRVEGGSDTRPAILIIGEDVDGVAATLAGHGEITGTASLFEAEDLLTRRNFDAAVLSFTEEPEGLLAFCSQVRNNPRLFNLPMVLVGGGDTVDAYRRGATRVLSRPVDATVLRCAVLSLVRRQQLRWSIRSVLFESLTPATSDPVTGVYGRAFLDAYLTSRLAIARTQNRHLAVVFFSIPGVESVRRQFGDDAALHLVQQLGQWITGLLRAEDMTALYERNQFCVVLPDTPVSEAEIVMHRIAGVLGYTDFAVREVYQPVKVWVQVGCTAALPEDDLASVLERAHRNLD